MQLMVLIVSIVADQDLTEDLSVNGASEQASVLHYLQKHRLSKIHSVFTYLSSLKYIESAAAKIC
jgi:hypothetical protein